MEQILRQRENVHRKASKLEDENKRLKSQLQQLRALANLGMVCSFVGHEINNVLTPIGSYAQLAMGSPDDKALTLKAQEKAVKNCARAQQLVDKISHVINDKKTQPSTLSASELVKNVFEMIGRDMSKDRIKLQTHIEDGLELYACAVDIEHILINLILNARDAMAGKGGSLEISAYKKDGSVFFEVSDTGVGIEKEKLSNIFEPFYSTKKNNKKLHGGTGLGLCFCREIVEQIGGSITVESEVGSGTKFKIQLPQLPDVSI